MPVVLPLPAVIPLTGGDAIAIVKRARTLLRHRRITHRQHALLDCLLWSCRNPHTGRIRVSYTALQRLACLSRGAIAVGLQVLEKLGVLTRIKHRVRVSWHQGGCATRQATNSYILHVSTSVHSEFAVKTVIQTIEILEQEPTTTVCDAQAALAARRQVIEARLRAAQLAGSPSGR